MSYAESVPVYRLGVPIPANMPSVSMGTPTGFTVDPPLPSGLALNAATGAISGTPTELMEASEHTVSTTTENGTAWAMMRIHVRLEDGVSLEPKLTFSDDEIRHFLERTHFGFDAPSYERILTVGMDRYVDEILALVWQSSVENPAADLFLEDENDPSGVRPSETDLARWWTYLIIWNPNPFQEVLALHWHDHFATSSEVLSSSKRRWFVWHANLWRQRGAGNLRSLLIDMARDWAMLEWLDGIRNDGGEGEAPNENFAREFFELFCLGVDNGYSEQDIVEAARAFSGYERTWDGELSHVTFDPERHDPDAKVVLGQAIPGQNLTDDYEAVVDATLALRDASGQVSRCAQWIVRSLLRRFCYDDPPQEVIDALARELEDGGWELKPVLKRLFLAETFYCAQARTGKVKDPITYAVGFMRASGLRGEAHQVDNHLVKLGMRPTQPPGVEGWPEGSAWLSAQAMIDRANLVRYLISARTYQSELGITPLATLPPGTTEPDQIVDALALRFGITPSADDRTRWLDYLDSHIRWDSTVEHDPFSVADTRHVDERLRGLMYIISQHPHYVTH